VSEIKDGVYASVAGTVGRNGTAKNGPYAVVDVTRDGSQYPDRVTVWGLDAATGDRVSVKGWLSWRKNERDGKVYVDVSLNKPEVVKHETSDTRAWPADDSQPF
jgi:hypothetical protein